MCIYIFDSPSEAKRKYKLFKRHVYSAFCLPESVLGDSLSLPSLLPLPAPLHLSLSTYP